ncbi:hypothetical protein BDZ89DRAFT_739984 [Hymenopellis radicata]|nr:hypothetical protein BDZ89DRAFT_739984 [Hymenopellis radicata]
MALFCMVYCVWRVRRNRRRRRLGLDVRPLYYASRFTTPNRPAFHDVWINAPSHESSWNNIKPVSLEKITSITNQPKKKKSVRSLFFKSKDWSSSTVDSNSDNGSIREKAVSPLLQLAVFIAMPSPAGEKRLAHPADSAEISVGILRVPFEGKI